MSRLNKRSSAWVAFLFAASMGWADDVAFFYALDADLQGLKTLVQEVGQPVAVGSRNVQRLRLGSHSIYAVKMGSGAVETAISAQALLSRFPCDWAFSLGPAGALCDELDVGGWIRVEQVVAWQKGMENESGFMLSPTAHGTTRWEQLPVEAPPAPLEASRRVVLASGEVFIASSNERERLRTQTQADAVDMNQAGLFPVCADHRVPLFTWKVVSDRADENASEAFRAFLSAYAGEGGKAIAQMIQQLPANPNDPHSYPAIEELLKTTALPEPFPPSSDKNRTDVSP